MKLTKNQVNYLINEKILNYNDPRYIYELYPLKKETFNRVMTSNSKVVFVYISKNPVTIINEHGKNLLSLIDSSVLDDILAVLIINYNHPAKNTVKIFVDNCNFFGSQVIKEMIANKEITELQEYLQNIGYQVEIPF